jgi:hypothetical protein
VTFEAEAGEAGEGWGSGAHRDAWKGKRGRERGPRARRGQHAWPASALGWRAQATVLRHDSGGWRGAIDLAQVVDMRGRAATGPCGQRLGAGGRGSAAAVLTHGTQPTAGEGGRREARAAHGLTRKKNEVGRAPMNSDYFYFFNSISN